MIRCDASSAAVTGSVFEDLVARGPSAMTRGRSASSTAAAASAAFRASDRKS